MTTSDDQAITVRIVFDGTPYAGKTTAAHTLGASLGREVVTPDQPSARTTWFDWVDYTGGRHEGRPIRVELVTVPGQAFLNSRRRHLLEWGDVVVFVADTRAPAFAASVEAFARLRADLADLGERPVVMLANKRDLDDVLPLERVRTELGLADDEPLVEGVATTGAGIRHAFIFAVRAAIARDTTRFDSTTAEELFDGLRVAVEHADDAASMDDTSRAGSEPDAAPVVRMWRKPPAPQPDELQSAEAAVSAQATELSGVTPMPSAAPPLPIRRAQLPRRTASAPGTPETEPAAPDERSTDTRPTNTGPTSLAIPAGALGATSRSAPRTTPPSVGPPRLNRAAVDDETGVLLSAGEWRLLVDWLSGDVDPLAADRETAVMARRLVERGIVRLAPTVAGRRTTNSTDGSTDDSTDDSVDGSTDCSADDAGLPELVGVGASGRPAAGADDNQRYRALKQLMRSLRD